LASTAAVCITAMPIARQSLRSLLLLLLGHPPPSSRRLNRARRSSTGASTCTTSASAWLPDSTAPPPPPPPPPRWCARTRWSSGTSTCRWRPGRPRAPYRTARQRPPCGMGSVGQGQGGPGPCRRTRALKTVAEWGGRGSRRVRPGGPGD
jgi:hypothetical protein